MHYLKAIGIGLLVFGVMAGMVILGLVLGDEEDATEEAGDEDVYSFMLYTKASDGGIHPWGDLEVLQEFAAPPDFSEIKDGGTKEVVYVYR